MTDSMILGVGIFAFVMALTGLVLTVIEFRRTVLPKAAPARRAPTIDKYQAVAQHTR